MNNCATRALLLTPLRFARSANRVEDILLYLVRHLMFVEWDMPTDPALWFDHFIGLDFMDATTVAWSTDRAVLWGKPTSDMSRADATDLMWNCIPCFIAGFFGLLNPSSTAHALTLRKALSVR